MKTEYKGIEWLLDCEPRLVQLEANARSYTGMAYRTHRDDKPQPRRVGNGVEAGYALFMEMRLGKTFALLNEYLLLRRDHGFRRLLVFAPSKYKHAWKLEAEKVGVDAKIQVFETKRALETYDWIAKGGEILIVNYEAMQFSVNMKPLGKFIYSGKLMVAADESILIKNHSTLTYKNAYALSRAAPIRRILTGKPVVQGPHDLWSQLNYIERLNGFNYYAFRNTFCKMGGFKGKQIKGILPGSEKQLQRILAPCSFTAERRYWGTHFDSDYEIRSPAILPEQAKHYQEMKDDFITVLKSGIPITADQVITSHMKLQQISSGFIIDAERNRHNLVDPAKLPKLIDLKESLENEVSHKALVICFYKYTLEVLLDQLKSYNPALIAGTTTMADLKRDIEIEKRRFNTDPTCKIMVAQIQAVKYGHNLASNGECDTIFYYENRYSLDDRAQSEQRPQGEEQIVGIHIVDYATTPIELTIIKALQRKQDIAAAILQAYK